MSQDPKKPAPLSPVLSAILKGVPLATAGMTHTGVGFTTGSGGLPVAGAGGRFGLSDLDVQRMQALETEIVQLRQQLDAQARALHSAQQSAGALAETQKTLSKLREKEQIAFLLDRVDDRAGSALLAAGPLRDQFLDGEPKRLYAMSVDIRRSTELMLKARTSQDFADFITVLCKCLMDVVRRHHGVVDKFTGDGILAFFPEFFSGEDAGYLAVAAAEECHRAFAGHYRDSRHRFTSVLRDIGLGIGIDYGACHLVQVAGTLTVVGAPVVYACRLGGGPAGVTLLNQPAYECVSRDHGQRLLVSETAIDIKHEGVLVAYAVRLNAVGHAVRPPAWLELPVASAEAKKTRSSD